MITMEKFISNYKSFFENVRYSHRDLKESKKRALGPEDAVNTTVNGVSLLY